MYTQKCRYHHQDYHLWLYIYTNRYFNIYMYIQMYTHAYINTEIAMFEKNVKPVNLNIRYIYLFVEVHVSMYKYIN